MRYSKLFVKTLKQAPKDADTTNHKLLVQAGFVRQLMAGVYSYLPFGQRVINKISQIVREEMNAVGGQEILMPALQPSNIWKQSGGWDGVDVLFKLKSRTDKDYALGQSHEEVVTSIVKEMVSTYRDLPIATYQIQWKFRDELRSKSGILRGREFLMKDMYSFHVDQKDFEKFYTAVREAYLKVFKRLGLDAKVTEASGGSFSEKISYEFEVLTDAGEANILYCDACDYCVNVDDISKYKEDDTCPSCGKEKLKPATAAEVGNIFDLGQKYVKAFDLTFIDEKGKREYPIMGCYGIGISRTMGVIVEKFHDEKGIIWPEAIAPFHVHLISLRNDDDAYKKAEKLYEELTDKGVEVLWDEREGLSPGERFADADLIGIPLRAVVSEKSLAGGGVEVKKRNESEAKIVGIDKLSTLL